MSEEIKVSVICFAYNHEPFIRKCLDGFVMQKTNFKFEVLINDDASTDGTAEIIKEYEKKYPDIIKPIYQKENQFSKGISIGATFLYPKVAGKYIAFCEGDDYWTDPEKLQIQVDFLESHPDFTGCFHKSVRRDVKTNKDLSFMPTQEALRGKTVFTIKEIRKYYFIETPSVMYRFGKYKEELLSEYPEKIVNVDSWFIYFFSLRGKIKYIDRLMSIKTINETGIWNSSIQSEDERNIKYAEKIVNFPIVCKKMFAKYGLEPPIKIIDAFNKVIKSAIKLDRDDVIVQITKQYFNDYINDNSTINRMKKYKKYFNILLIVCIVLVVIILSLLICLICIK